MPESPPDQPTLNPIGTAHTPWKRGHCPKNMNAARASGEPAHLTIDAAVRPGLLGLERASHIIILGWFGNVDRNVLLQHPSHLPREFGCFALRTPARPNPIALSIAKIAALNTAAGRIDLDALDWFDGTPVLDLKPYFASTDAIPDARIADPS